MDKLRFDVVVDSTNTCPVKGLVAIQVTNVVGGVATFYDENLQIVTDVKQCCYFTPERAEEITKGNGKFRIVPGIELMEHIVDKPLMLTTSEVRKLTQEKQ